MTWYHNGRKYWKHNGKTYSRKIRFKKGKWRKVNYKIENGKYYKNDVCKPVFSKAIPKEYIYTRVYFNKKGEIIYE